MVGWPKSHGKKISAVLPDLVQDQGWEKQLDLHSIFPRWQELVGEDVAPHTRPLKVERSVLWIEVENSAWFQQLQYMKLDLLDILNGALKITRINDIKMVLPKGAWQPAQEPEQKVSFVRPDAKKTEAFSRQAECIQDEACRAALMQFWYLAHALKKEK